MPRARSLRRGSSPTMSMPSISLPANRARSASALDDVHGEPAARGLLVLAPHVGAGPPHRLDDLVERDLVRAIALECEPRGVDRLDGAHRVALDARDLDEPADRIA